MIDLRDQQRFKERRIQRSAEKCWIWFGGTDKNGYGKFKIGERDFAAHRIAYEIEFGEFDLTLFVLHRCDNPPCVNPNHLFLGTAKDNCDDMMRKGRRPKTYNTATCNAIVKEAIKYVLRTEFVRNAEIARRFGVTAALVKECKDEVYGRGASSLAREAK